MCMRSIRVGDAFRVTYVSKCCFNVGLTDVMGYMFSPTGEKTYIPWSGNCSASGFCELADGVYYYDWCSTGKAVGVWLFIVGIGKTYAYSDAISVILMD